MVSPNEEFTAQSEQPLSRCAHLIYTAAKLRETQLLARQSSASRAYNSLLYYFIEKDSWFILVSGFILQNIDELAHSCDMTWLSL